MSAETLSVAPPLTYALEVVTLPVADVDRSLAFYTDGLGFTLEVDYQPEPGFRVVQLTPPVRKMAPLRDPAS